MTKAIDTSYYDLGDCEVKSVLTDEEIAFFKKGLEEQKVKIITNLNITSTELDNFIDNDPKDEGDLASIAFGQSLGSNISNRQAKNLLLIEKSIQKIEHECYGICELCDEPIQTERLKVKMFAEYCISCREVVEKEGR